MFFGPIALNLIISYIEESSNGIVNNALIIRVMDWEYHLPC